MKVTYIQFRDMVRLGKSCSVLAPYWDQPRTAVDSGLATAELTNDGQFVRMVAEKTGNIDLIPVANCCKITVES